MEKSIQASIVIPTYERPDTLLKCLVALSRQSMSDGYEIIVVDDGSRTDMKSIVASLGRDDLIRYFWQENQGPAAARNYGVSKAKGQYIAFTDDDCEPATDWLVSLLTQATPTTIIGGYTANGLRDNLFAEASQLLISFLYVFFKGSPHYFFTSNNLCIHRDTLLGIGGFDTEFFRTSAGEDRELCVRWQHLGHDLVYDEAAVVYHYHSSDALSFRQMHFKYGTSGWAFHQKMEHIGISLSDGQKNFFNKLLKYPFRFRQYSWKEKWVLAYLLAISQIQGRKGYSHAKKQAERPSGS